MGLDLTVITPTWNRPKVLALVIEAFRRQSHRLEAEHFVIADGHDREARSTCEAQGYGRPREYTIMYTNIEHVGDFGGRYGLPAS